MAEILVPAAQFHPAGDTVSAAVIGDDDQITLLAPEMADLQPGCRQFAPLTEQPLLKNNRHHGKSVNITPYIS